MLPFRTVFQNRFARFDRLMQMDNLKSLCEGAKSAEVFEVQLNAGHYGDFKASEIGVSVVDGAVEIIGKQVWRQHPGGSHRREFVHRLLLPGDVNTEMMTAYMTRDGNVIVRAPRHSAAQRIRTDLMIGREKSVRVGGVTEVYM